MSDPQQEYTDARAAYDAALTRLREAKRHIPQSPRDRFRQRQREKREAQRAKWAEMAAAREAAGDAPQLLTIEMITVKALAILHQRCNAIADAETKIGQSLRISLPMTYRINDGPPIGNDDE